MPRLSLPALLPLCLATALVACGGGGSVSATSGTPASSSSLAGSSVGASASSASSLASSSASSAPAAPLALSVPALAYDDSSLTLVWSKPTSYADIVDYVVYRDGVRLGTASANASLHSPAKPYMDAFAAADSAGFHVRPSFLSYRVSGLTAATRYSFTVRALNAAGVESADSTALSVSTAPAYGTVVNIASAGAKGDGSTVNTSVIQQAIDTCAASSSTAWGCKVVVPAGDASGAVFLSGALFLRSNMTLEIQAGATLKGSANTADYPLAQGYQLYSFKTNSTDDRRPPSLLNALSSARSTTADARTGYDETRGALSNIRVIGGGVLDGNGWNTLSSITDEAGLTLPQYAAGGSGTVASLGKLAASQLAAARAEYGGSPTSTQLADLYSNRRSSLATFRGVRNAYFSGLTLRNPAYHGVMFLESENVVFAHTTSQTYDTNNGDGVEFGNSDGALIFGNFFDTGDDCVNFAAGQGAAYASAAPQQNVRIFNNYMRMGHGGVVTGSHTGAWIQDILAEDNVMNLTDIGLRMKSTPATGGGARRVVFRDNALKAMAKQSFIFTLAYSAGSNSFANAPQSAQFRDITVRNISLDGSTGATFAVDGYAGADATLGYAETFQEALSFSQMRIRGASAASISRLKNSSFTDISITGCSSSFWSTLANSSGLSFKNVSCQTDTP